MNIALEQTEEYVNGNVTNRYGDCFVRGNNGKSIRLEPRMSSSQCPLSALYYCCRGIVIVGCVDLL